MGYKDDIVDQYPYLTYANEPGATIEDAGGGGGGGGDTVKMVIVTTGIEPAPSKVTLEVGTITGTIIEKEFTVSASPDNPVYNEVSVGYQILIDIMTMRINSASVIMPDEDGINIPNDGESFIVPSVDDPSYYVRINLGPHAS